MSRRQILATACLAFGGGAIFTLYAILKIFYPGMVVEYGYSAYQPGPFEGAFLLWYSALAVLATAAIGGALLLLFAQNSEPGTRNFLVPWCLGGSILFLVLAAKFLVLHNSPTMDDENLYHFTAQLITHGKLTIETTVPCEFFSSRWGILCESGRIYGMYPHGWPLVLALGYLAHAPWLVNPLLALGIVFLAVQFARRVYGPGTARMTAWIFAFSPLFLLTSGTDLSEPTVAFGVLGAIVSAIRYSEDSRARWLWLFGAAGGLAFLARQLTAMALLAPFVLYLLVRLWRRPSHVLALFLPLLAACAAYLAFNHATTGSAFVPGYNAFLRTRGYTQGVVGFGVDYTSVGGNGIHTVARGIVNGFINLVRLNMWLLGWPFSLLLVLGARMNTWTRLVLAAFGTQLVVYVAFNNPGLCLTGPVYYYEVGCLLLVLAADALNRLPQPFLRTAVVTIAIVNATMFAPTYVRSIYHMTEGTRMLTRAVEEAGLRNAVVFVKNVQPQWEAKAIYKSFVFHPITNASWSDPVVYLNDRGDEKNRASMKAYFPGRQAFRYGIEEDWKPRLIPYP